MTTQPTASHFVDGAYREDSAGEAIPVVYPATGEEIARVFSATDAVVEEGRSAVDMSMLTGESVPVEVEPGSDVVGATINAGGRLVVRTTKVGAATALAKIGRLVSLAQAGKAPVKGRSWPGMRRIMAGLPALRSGLGSLCSRRSEAPQG